MSTKFMEVPAWKKLQGMDPEEKFAIKRNKKSDALSILLPDGRFFKCQGDFNPKKPHCFLIPDGVLDESCLINYDDSKATLETIGSL